MKKVARVTSIAMLISFMSLLLIMTSVSAFYPEGFTSEKSLGTSTVAYQTLGFATSGHLFLGMDAESDLDLGDTGISTDDFIGLTPVLDITPLIVLCGFLVTALYFFTVGIKRNDEPLLERGISMGIGMIFLVVGIIGYTVVFAAINSIR